MAALTPLRAAAPETSGRLEEIQGQSRFGGRVWDLLRRLGAPGGRQIPDVGLLAATQPRAGRKRGRFALERAARIVLAPRRETGWEDDINRPVVLKRGDVHHLWYTGQWDGHSAIGYATSADGFAWKRMSDRPVLSADQPWEKVAVMCPHVLWDEAAKLFRMWYSGGEQYEPDAIGYATSPDGMHWTKAANNPVFKSDPGLEWERHKVTACQVIPEGGWYVMFYIGFRDVDHAQIGLARSKDGLSDWQRLAANPIVRPDPGQWDHDACYKPCAIFEGTRWLLWYNGRHGGLEQIGPGVSTTARTWGLTTLSLADELHPYRLGQVTEHRAPGLRASIPSAATLPRGTRRRK